MKIGNILRSRFFRIFCLVFLFCLLITPLLKPLRPYSQTAPRNHSEITSVHQLEAKSDVWRAKAFTTELKWESDSAWQVQSIDITLGTYFKNPILLGATITGPNCRLKAPWWASLQDNMHVRFDADGVCQLSHGDTLTLSISTLKASALAVMLVPKVPPASLRLSSMTEPTQAIMATVQGAAVSGRHEEPILRRFEALAKFWNLGSLVFLLGVMLCALVITGSLSALSAESVRHKYVALPGLIFAICAYYALISPPLQGPDEATHFNSYLSLTGQNNKLGEVGAWASRIHYSRVNCDISSCISSQDMSEPSKVNLPHYVNTLEVLSRSALGGFALSRFGRLIDHLPIEHQLLALRFLSLVSSTFLIFVSLVIFFPHHSLPAQLALSVAGAWLVIPTFGFLTMNANNHSITITGYVCLLIGCLSTQINPKNITPKRLLWPGLLAAGTFLSGRTGIAGSVLLLSAYYVFASLACRGFKNWILGTASLALSFCILIFEFRDSRYIVDQIPGAQHRLGLIAYQIGLSPISLLITTGCILIGVVSALRFIVNRLEDKKITSRSVKPKTTSLGAISLFVGLVTLILLIYPLIYQTSAVPDIEFRPHGFTRFDFVTAVLKSFWLNFGIHGQDFFIHWSLWAGFGCPDRALPNIFLQILKVTILLGIGLGFSLALWRRHIRAIFTNVLGLILMSIWTIVVSIMILPIDGATGINPHGRFFIGTGLVAGFLSVHGWSSIIQLRKPKQGNFILLLVLALIGLGGGSWFWLDRFFR